MLNKCNVCGAPVLDALSQIIYVDGAVDEQFERRCAVCKNLIYGSIKRIKNGGNQNEQ